MSVLVENSHIGDLECFQEPSSPSIFDYPDDGSVVDDNKSNHLTVTVEDLMVLTDDAVNKNETHESVSSNPTSIPTFSLKDITSSSYYSELANGAVTKNIDFFATVCKHKIGERLKCLKNLLTKLSKESEAQYNFGRVLYLALLWEEGKSYINGLSEEQAAEELSEVLVAQPQTSRFALESLDRIASQEDKSCLILWLNVTAQKAVNSVVSRLNSGSLDILNSLTGDDEIVIVDYSSAGED